MKLKKFQIVLVVLVLVLSLSQVALAATWEKTIVQPKIIMPFAIIEEGIPIPFPINVGGGWKECWNGTSGGYATLTRLYQSQYIQNWDGGPRFYVDDFGPEAKYTDSTRSDYWNIVYPYNWTLQTPTSEYCEGYNNPGTYYNNPSVKGYLKVYGEGLAPVSMIKSTSWVQ